MDKQERLEWLEKEFIKNKIHVDKIIAKMNRTTEEIKKISEDIKKSGEEMRLFNEKENTR